MLLSVTFCDGQVSGKAKYLVGDSTYVNAIHRAHGLIISRLGDMI